MINSTALTPSTLEIRTLDSVQDRTALAERVGDVAPVTKLGKRALKGFDSEVPVFSIAPYSHPDVPERRVLLSSSPTRP
jgi:class 3 adenylate cyclase